MNVSLKNSFSSSSTSVVLDSFFIRKGGRRTRTIVASIALVFSTGCATAPALVSTKANNPADPHAAEAATRPLRPMLVATTRTFLSPAADDREETAKQMDMSKMKQPGMQHEMPGMEHGSMEGMQGMSPAPKPTPSPPNDAQSVPTGSYYTCPMHSEVKEAKPGQCPICGITLVKKEAQS